MAHFPARAMRVTLALAALGVGACDGAPETREPGARPLHGALEGEPRARASAEFSARWSDGRAELATYRGTVMRYGAAREAELVTILVTEPLDRRTLVKDDLAPEGERVQVLKLNAMLRFQTGIYPYSVMTSTFMPVDAYFAERFAPAKITLSAQEWCGHVWLGIWPDASGYAMHGLSYFPEDGERSERVEAPADTLYEDALLVQLRELDGPFHGGAPFSGFVVPSLWSSRREHAPLRPLAATITRAPAAEEVAEERFVLAFEGGRRTTFVVERGGEQRLVRIESDDGERFELVASERLPYWSLNGVGEESARASIGLHPRAYPPAPAPPEGAPPEAATEIGSPRGPSEAMP